MRPFGVVPLEPLPDDGPRVSKAPEVVLPGTFFFQTAEEPLDQTVLRGGVGRDEFLREPRVPTGGSEAPTVENEAVVTAEVWGDPSRAQRPEACQARGLQGSLSLLRSTAERELIPQHFAIMTIDHGRPMRPAVLAAGNMGHLHRPALIAAAGPAALAPRPWPRGHEPLMHQPPVQLQEAVDRFAIHAEALAIAEQRPETAIAKGCSRPA